MIPQETVNKIIDSARIEEVVGDFVPLKKRGANYTACCPFHNEKTPSFSVSPSKGIYKCFGCGKAGTAVGFVMEHENMSYSEALKYLARKYHIEVVEKEESAEEIAQRQRNESLLLVSEYAAKFFRESLDTREGQAIAYQYFKSRGLTDETIKKYGLGWAPVSRNSLFETARAAGYREEFLIETGLCLKYDDGRLMDRFYDRVIFPIHSVSGRVIAFGGRTLKTDKTVAKYVNSPETDIYVKSRSLYGIYFAKSEISKSDKCILVEGYLDVLSMHQLGITNVVASSGTSLTVEQIRLIRKFTNNITIVYDGDSAGIKAAMRGIDLVLKEGMNVKIVLLPDGQDPDDFARANSLDTVRDYILGNEKDFLNFKTELLLKEAGDDPIARAELINEISDTISLIPDAVKRTVYVQIVAEKFKVDFRILTERVNRTRSKALLDEQKQRERERQRNQSAYGVPPPASGDDMEYLPEPPPLMPELPSGPIVISEPHLAACEKELLAFILEEGCTELKFDADSKYYIKDETETVVEFIESGLAEDDDEFVNPSYRKVYNEYYRLYEENLPQETIQQRLLNSPDEEIAAVAKDLLIDKYQITVRNYENSMTATATILVRYIPKTLLTYKLKKVELLLAGLTEDLNHETDAEKQVGIIVKMQNFNKIKTALNNELGRV